MMVPRNSATFRATPYGKGPSAAGGAIGKGAAGKGAAAWAGNPYATPMPVAAAAEGGKPADEGRMIYVGGVPETAEWQELKDHMKEVGTVEFVQVLTNECGKSRGVGFVRYSTEDEAQRAIAELTGTVMAGGTKPLVVDPWTGQKPMTAKGKAPAGCGKGGGGGGGGGWDAASAGKGKGGGVWVPTDMYNMMMGKKGGGGKTAWAAPAAAGAGGKNHDPTFKVRVENLPAEAKWQELKDLCKQAGTVEFCNTKGTSGEVRFSCAEDAQTAIAMLNGADLMGSTITVEDWS